MVSQGLSFVLSAFRSAKRTPDKAAFAALRIAIEHGMKFGEQDGSELAKVVELTDCRYGEAVKSGNLSFCKMLEKRRGMEPWLWPSELVRESTSPKKERLYVGCQFWWYDERRNDFRLWKVTQVHKDKILAVVTKQHDGWTLPRGEDQYKDYRCSKCGDIQWGKVDRHSSKVVRRATLTRDVYDNLWSQWSAFSRRKILSIDGLFTWRATEYEGRLSPRESAWDTLVVRAQDRYNGSTHAGQSTECVLLRSEGVLKHGRTLREARKFRNQAIRDADALIRESVSRHIDLDVPRTAPTDDWRVDNIPAFCKAIVRREFTARELFRAIALSPSSSAHYDSRKYDITEAGRILFSDHEQRIAAQHAEEERKQRWQETLASFADHGNVRVSVKHAREAGFCDLGIAGWLRSNFPEILPDSLRADHVSDYSAVFKIRKTIPVKKILDLPPSEVSLAGRAIELSIQGAKKGS